MRLDRSEFARKADKTVGPLSISLSQKAEAYERRAKALRRLASFDAVPFAGGISISRKDTVESDTDRVDPVIHVGMMDHPDVASSSTST